MVALFHQKFNDLISKEMPALLLRSLGIILDKQTSFEKTTKQYEKIVAGYYALFGIHDQLCTDLMAKLRDCTTTKFNLALLKFATE